jgi:hypothetical protein
MLRPDLALHAPSERLQGRRNRGSGGAISRSWIRTNCHILDDLFDRLRKAGEQAKPRDADAEALVARQRGLRSRS